MWNITTMLAAAALLSGCVNLAGIDKRRTVNRSTGGETAIIEAQSYFNLLVEKSCRISRPVIADSLVVDAGPVRFAATCIYQDIVYEALNASANVLNARFSFVADAGHTYTLALNKGECMELIDVTADQQVVACEPYFYGRFADQSTGSETAMVKAGNKGCLPTTGQGRRKRQIISAPLLFVDAGPVTVEASCDAEGFWQGWRKRRGSRFDFVAEVGHTYTFSAKDSECMRLLDITSEETVIACEPYEPVD